MENVLALSSLHGAPIGEILLRQNHLSNLQLARALDVQAKNGGRLGPIFVTEGMIGYRELTRALASHYNLPLVDLLKTPPDAALCSKALSEEYVQQGALPWRRDGKYIILAVTDLTDEVMAWAHARCGAHIRLAITSPFDIRRAVENLFSREIEQSSRLSLWKRFPHASARVTILPQQKQFFIGAAIMAVAFIAHAPVMSALYLIMFCHVIYAATLLFKAGLFTLGIRREQPQDWKTRLATLDERRLPVYTVLVPMYKEAQSLPGLLASMQRLDYPPAKLDIKLVLEADDMETLNAARALKPRYQFDIIRVPKGDVRTKPRACNYALRFARGEYVTVFDADDRPERLQLKKAVWTFRRLPPHVACLQSRLNYYNANDNLLTRLFSLEYGILFHFMLYGLERLGLPIPLGGTSNHIALAKLREVGEWDAYNVTEDADLGMRLAARGLSTAMLDSDTVEEAPNAVMPWIRQRSRWIKGYMQTWLVHMRHPVRLYRKLGARGFIGFQFFIGFPSFVFLTAPLVWLLSLFWLAGVAHLHHVEFPRWLVMLTVGNFAVHLTTQWGCALYCATRYHKHALQIAGAALIYPLYMWLHSLASYKALWQLIVKPHFWEKTTHGLARHIELPAATSSTLVPRRGILLTSA